MSKTEASPSKSPANPAPKRSKRQFSAEEKTRAVLAIWTERRRPVDLCRELEITPTLLDYWQKKAMRGLLKALAPRPRAEEISALSTRIEKILAEQVPREPVTKLARRLGQMKTGASRTTPPPSDPEAPEVQSA